MNSSFMVHFQIIYKTIPGENLLISGSCEEMGNWTKQIPMKWNTGHLWTAVVKINTLHFQYKHLFKSAAGVAWETGINRDVDLTLFDSKEPKLTAEWESFKIIFLLYNPPYEPTKVQMRINGKIPELGEWEKEIVNMKLTKKSHTFNNHTDVLWKKTILRKMYDFPHKFDYKYTSFEHSKKLVLWEREPSRQFNLKTAENLEGKDVLVNNRVVMMDANYVTNLIFDKIGDYPIYIGPYPQSADEINILIKEGITAVICAQSDIDIKHRQIDWVNIKKYYSENNIKLVHFPIHDFNHENLVERLPEGAKELNNLLREKRVVYVHCTAGMGRAPAIVVMYLCFYHSMEPDEAYDYVHSHRACAVPNKVAIQTVYDKMKEKEDQ